MERFEALQAIKTKKREKKITFETLAKEIGRSPVYIAAVLNGQQRLGPEETKKLAKTLDLSPEVAEAVTGFPIRTDYPITVDPFKYRLMEIVGVYGDSLREMANEMFGDGIMSAIDFSLDMEKVIGPQGEARVKITMNGKWLQYKEF